MNASFGTERSFVDSCRAIEEPPRKFCINIIDRSSEQTNCVLCVT